jgi:hypothetical protein
MAAVIVGWVPGTLIWAVAGAASRAAETQMDARVARRMVSGVLGNMGTQ